MNAQVNKNRVQHEKRHIVIIKTKKSNLNAMKFKSFETIYLHL